MISENSSKRFALIDESIRFPRMKKHHIADDPDHAFYRLVTAIEDSKAPLSIR